MIGIRIEDIHLGSKVTYITMSGLTLTGVVTDIDSEDDIIEVDNRIDIEVCQVTAVETQYPLGCYETSPRSLASIKLRPWTTGVGKSLLFGFNKASMNIRKVVFNGPATIVWFSDGTKTIVKKTEDDTDDREKAILLAVTKKLLGNSTSDLRKYLKDVESKVDNQNKKGE